MGKDDTVTGVDLSEMLLSVARQRADQENLSVTFIQNDMRNLDFHQEFVGVFNMFTSFGYLENETEDEKVLMCVGKALKKGGRFLLDTINHGWIVLDFIAKEWRIVGQDSLVLDERNFDHLTVRLKANWTVITNDGNLYTLRSSIRTYRPIDHRKLG